MKINYQQLQKIKVTSYTWYWSSYHRSKRFGQERGKKPAKRQKPYLFVKELPPSISKKERCILNSSSRSGRKGFMMNETPRWAKVFFFDCPFCVQAKAETKVLWLTKGYYFQMRKYRFHICFYPNFQFLYRGDQSRIQYKPNQDYA